MPKVYQKPDGLSDMKHAIYSTYCIGKKNIFRVCKNDIINFSVFNGEVGAKNSFSKKSD